LIVLGPGQALLALIPRPGLEARHLIELCVGVGLLVLAGVLWFGRKRVGRDLVRDEDRFDRSSFLVGAGISLVELPTAFPYFAALAAIVGSGKSAFTQIGVLVAYNAVFVAPLLAILGVRLLARERGRSSGGVSRDTGRELVAVVASSTSESRTRSARPDYLDWLREA
jgi:cytochrome c biogenesis protein CcdA